MSATAADPRERDPRVHGVIGTGVLARLLGTGSVMVLGIVTTSLAVRLLGASSYGILAYAASTGALVAGMARLGLEPGLARAVTSARAAEPPGDLVPLTRGASMLTIAGGGASAAVVVLLVAFTVHGAPLSTKLLVGASIALYTFATNAAAVTGALARGLARMPVMEVPNVSLSVARLAALAAIAGAGAGSLRTVSAAYAAAGAAALVASAVIARSLTGGLDRPLAPAARPGAALLRTTTPFVITGVATLALSRVDVLVLGLTHPSAAVGSYEPTLKLVEQAMLWAPLLFIGPFLPVATRLHALGDQDGFRDLYLSSSKLVLVAALPAVLLLAADPAACLHVLYGSSYHARAAVVWILLGGFAVNLAFGLNTNALAAAGTRAELVRVGIFSLVSMVVLASALVPPFGAIGAAVATSATYTVVNITASAALHTAARVPPFDRALATTAASATLPLAGLAALHHAAPGAPFSVDVLETLAAWGAWVGILLALRALSVHEIVRLLPRRGGR